MTNDLALAALVRWPVVPSEGKADAANQPARHCEPRRGVAIQRPYPIFNLLDRVATLAMTAPIIASVFSLQPRAKRGGKQSSPMQMPFTHWIATAEGLAMTAPVIANVVKHPSRCAANLHRWPSRPR